MMEASSDSKSKAATGTVGEELYLVHLRRHEGEEPRAEDFDIGGSPRTKKRSHSAGEELWGIHLKRSRGLESDVDLTKQEGGTGQETLKEPSKPCRYNLRTRRGVSKAEA